jgi:hypothetical protein
MHDRERAPRGHHGRPARLPDQRRVLCMARERVAPDELFSTFSPATADALAHA